MEFDIFDKMKYSRMWVKSKGIEVYTRAYCTRERKDDRKDWVPAFSFVGKLILRMI